MPKREIMSSYFQGLATTSHRVYRTKEELIYRCKNIPAVVYVTDCWRELPNHIEDEKAVIPKIPLTTMGRRNQVTLLSHPTPTNDNILIQADVKDEPDLQCEFSCEPAAESGTDGAYDIKQEPSYVLDEHTSSTDSQRYTESIGLQPSFHQGPRETTAAVPTPIKTEPVSFENSAVNPSVSTVTYDDDRLTAEDREQVHSEDINTPIVDGAGSSSMQDVWSSSSESSDQSSDTDDPDWEISHRKLQRNREETLSVGTSQHVSEFGVESDNDSISETDSEKSDVAYDDALQETNSLLVSSQAAAADDNHDSYILPRDAISTALLCNYQCPHCKMYMKSCDQLIEHVQTEHKLKGKKSCQEQNCEELIRTSRDELVHILRAHSHQLDFCCPICKDAMASREATKIHLSSSHAFGCFLCHIDFQTDHDLEDHYKKTHLSGSKYYRCSICSYTTAECSVSAFTAHIHEHFNLREYACRFCVPVKFYKVGALRGHIAKVHPLPSSDPYRCPDCPNYQSHSARYMAFHWKFGCVLPCCRSCGKMFWNTKSRNKHQLKCGKSDHLIKCAQCSYKFETRFSLRRHVHRIHDNSKLNCTKGDCSLCLKPRKLTLSQEQQSSSHKMLRRRSKIQHVGNTKSHSVDVVVAKRSNKSLFGDSLIQSDTKCRFPDCRFQGASPEILRDHVNTTHIQSSSKSGRAVCEICGKVARFMYGINIHKTSMHNFPSRHQCETCGKYFPYLERLTNHMIKSHGVGKSTKAQHEKTASHSKKKQKRTSKGRVILSCPLCDYTTAPRQSRRDLARHLFHKHYTKGEKIPEDCYFPLQKCPLCEYEAINDTRIIRHMKKHVKRGESIPEDYVVIEVPKLGDTK